MLKSLEIAGFKSFAKKTELHFKSRVTAIVGPNGSGKSNVAESFRFALGEQSIKSMRGRRGEDLIWNGSSEVGRSNRASVRLVFDNSKNLFSNFAGGMDFEEVAIERVVNRDGGNEYYLNGSLVRLKDVIELLSQAHIGASGHHIISQGEADRILTANMKERKEMIEDALGLKIYQYKREESQRKLQKTEENIKQVESLRREIAPHIKFLKKQVEKVEKAEELRLKLAKFYRQYLKREQIYLETEKREIESEQKPLKEKIEELEKAMEEAKGILAASACKDQKSDELIAIENQIKNEREAKDRLYREVGRIEGEIAANLRALERIKAEQRSEETKTILLKEVEDLEKEISAYSEIGKIIERVRSFIAGHKNNFNSKNLDELEALGRELLSEKEGLEEKVREIDVSLNRLNSQYEAILKSIEKEKDSSREAEKNIFKISSERSEARAKFDLLSERRHRLAIEENDWKREIAEGGILLGTAILGFENEEIEGEFQNQKQNSDSSSQDGSHGAQNFASGLNHQENREKQLERRKELEKMKIRLDELGGAGGSEVTKEYRDSIERDEFLQKELEDLRKSAQSLEILIKDLLEKLDVEFKDGIEKINKAFHEYFSIMFGGGEAKLEIEKLKIKKLDNEFDATQNENPELRGNPSGRRSQDFNFGFSEQEKIEEGVEIFVSLPRKRIKGLDMLSGGERALTSIALLFAVSQVNPPPFIILDETDAALDEANSKKYGDMIESLSKVSQLILITHNRETMSRAGVIYGVTMGKDGISRLLSIEFDEAVAVAK